MKTKRSKVRSRRRGVFALIIILLLAICGIGVLNLNKEDVIEGTILKSEIKSEIKGNRPKVVIDAGHGGYDEGTKGENNVYEKNITLDIALKVGKILEENNVNVIYTRKSDKVSWPSNEKKDLRERVNISNSNNADVFVSIHCNSFDDPKVRGVESWCRFKNTHGEKLAKSIQKNLAELKYTSNRGIKYEESGRLQVVKNTKAPATLLELGYLSNKSDLNYLKSKSGQSAIAKGIADGILEYFS